MLRCCNAKSLGQNKNVNLPGVHVDLPVLTDKDIDDLVNFAVRNKMHFVAASFVQSGNDVRWVWVLWAVASVPAISRLCDLYITCCCLPAAKIIINW